MKTNWLRLDAGAGGEGGGGGGNTFLATLPPELQKEPSLATFKDPGTLAKSYVEAQKLIGTKRIALPSEKATDAEWEAFYNNIGRPDTHDKYEDVVLKDEKGNVKLAPAKEEAAELKKLFHKIGLTARQAKAIQEYSLGYFDKTNSAASAEEQQRNQAGIQELKTEWGDKFNANVDTAKAVITKFGGEKAAEIQEFLNESGLGNNAQLVRLLSKIGDSILEDRGRRGPGGDGLPIADATRAQNEIQTLMTDTEFQKILNNNMAPGHAQALERWRNLFAVAYPGKSE